MLPPTTGSETRTFAEQFIVINISLTWPLAASTLRSSEQTKSAMCSDAGIIPPAHSFLTKLECGIVRMQFTPLVQWWLSNFLYCPIF